MAAHDDVEDGQIWLVTPATTAAWPVLICDEEIVKEYFKRASSRPDNARRADGMWPDGYGPGQQFARDRKLPAMYIGSLKMVWAPRSRLQPINLETALVEREFNPDAQLAQAYGEIVERLGCDSLRYYKDLLCARQLSDEEKAYYQDSDEASLPTEFLEESNGEADVSYMDDSCSDGDRSDDDRSDEEDQAAFVAKASEIKQEDTSTLNCILLPSHRNSLGNKEGAREADATMVDVYVGNPWQIFRVKHTDVELSSVLYNIVTFSPGDGYSAMSPLLSRIDPADFRPVAEYFEAGEYVPYIIDADTDYAYLDGLSGDEESREQVIQSGVIFRIAQLLELPGLQSLTLSKFKALQPYRAYEFLVVAGTSFGLGLAGDDRLDEFLVQYFAEHSLSLVEAEGKLVDQVLEKHPQFEEQISTMHQTSSLMKMPRTTRACLKSLELSEARLGQTEEGMADITDSDGINGAGQDHQDEQATEQRDGTFGVDTTPGLLG